MNLVDEGIDQDLRIVCAQTSCWGPRWRRFGMPPIPGSRSRLSRESASHFRVIFCPLLAFQRLNTPGRQRTIRQTSVSGLLLRESRGSQSRPRSDQRHRVGRRPNRRTRTRLSGRALNSKHRRDPRAETVLNRCPASRAKAKRKKGHGYRSGVQGSRPRWRRGQLRT
jgi:hypothetical protein